jgi:hypothetical protein
MPAPIHATVQLEHRLEYHLHEEPVRIELTFIRGLLEDVRAMHEVGFAHAFGAKTVQDLLDEWQQNGLKSFDVPSCVEKLRQVAFEADSLGEALMEIRNKRSMPDIAPGAVLVLCAILDYLASSCGSDGVVTFAFGEQAS